MREYGAVAWTFWTRGSGKLLRGHQEAQLVALYLMTSPHTTMVGIYHIALPTICHETGLPLKGARKGLARLSEVGLAHYDEEAELVWVPRLARYQIGERLSIGRNGRPDNRIVGVKRALEPYRGHPFHDDFVRLYGEAYMLAGEPLASPSEAPYKPLPRVSEGVPRARARVPAPDPVPDPDPVPEAPAYVSEPPGSAARPEPRGLDEAERVDIAERAQHVRANEHEADWLQPNRWSEVEAVAAAFWRAAGTPGARLGCYSRDSGVRAVVSAFADGWTLEQLLAAAAAIPREAGLVRDGRRPGLSSMTAEVIRRALASAPGQNQTVAAVLAEVEAEASGGTP